MQGSVLNAQIIESLYFTKPFQNIFIYVVSYVLIPISHVLQRI